MQGKNIVVTLNNLMCASIHNEEDLKPITNLESMIALLRAAESKLKVAGK